MAKDDSMPVARRAASETYTDAVQEGSHYIHDEGLESSYARS
jgi:hypothetical protein